MMEKVKITHEQADAIEKIKSGALMDVPLDNLIKAMIIGYEIEPEFKAGDWVAFKDGSNFNGYHKSRVEQITSVRASDAFYNDDCCVTSINKLRHATPEEIQKEKERRKWAEIGREVNEYKIGDIYFSNVSELHGFVRENHKSYIVNQNHVAILKEQITLVCPAEKRFDLNAK